MLADSDRFAPGELELKVVRGVMCRECEKQAKHGRYPDTARVFRALESNRLLSNALDVLWAYI